MDDLDIFEAERKVKKLKNENDFAYLMGDVDYLTYNNIDDKLRSILDDLRRCQL